MPAKRTLQEILGSEVEAGSILIVLFIPSKTKDGKDLPKGEDQELWADAAGSVLSDEFFGCTQMPVAKGMWKNDDGDIIKEAVILLHCYARPTHMDEASKIENLAKFLHRMGKKLHQGEIGIVIDNVFHRIRKFPLAEGK